MSKLPPPSTVPFTADEQRLWHRFAPASLGRTDYGDPLSFDLAVRMSDYDFDTTDVQLIGVLVNLLTQ